MQLSSLLLLIRHPPLIPTSSAFLFPTLKLFSSKTPSKIACQAPKSSNPTTRNNLASAHEL
jgi:hypothetical protein